MLRTILTICTRCGRLIHRCAEVCPMCGRSLIHDEKPEVEEAEMEEVAA